MSNQSIIKDYKFNKDEYKEMLDEQSKSKIKKAEKLTNSGLNFYDVIATMREKGEW